MCYHFKKTWPLQKSKSPAKKNRRNRLKALEIVPAIKTNCGKNSIPNNNCNHKNSKRQHRETRTVHPPCETCGKTNHSKRKCYFGANAAKRPPRGKDKMKCRKTNNQSKSIESAQSAAENLN